MAIARTATQTWQHVEYELAPNVGDGWTVMACHARRRDTVPRDIGVAVLFVRLGLDAAVCGAARGQLDTCVHGPDGKVDGMTCSRINLFDPASGHAIGYIAQVFQGA